LLHFNAFGFKLSAFIGGLLHFNAFGFKLSALGFRLSAFGFRLLLGSNLPDYLLKGN